MSESPTYAEEIRAYIDFNANTGQVSALNALDALLAENKRLREALERLYQWVYHGKGAVRNGMSVGSRVLPPELGDQIRAALAAVPEERG